MRNIKPTHRPVINFYAELKQYESLDATNETEIRLAFATLFQHYARQNNLTLICEKSLRTPKNTTIYVDGMLTDNDFGLPRGYWEAKDLHDNLIMAVKQKFDAGYPQDNILFTTQKRAILYQDGQEVMAVGIADRDAFIRVLHALKKRTPTPGFRRHLPTSTVTVRRRLTPTSLRLPWRRCSSNTF